MCNLLMCIYTLNVHSRYPKSKGKEIDTEAGIGGFHVVISHFLRVVYCYQSLKLVMNGDELPSERY